MSSDEHAVTPFPLGVADPANGIAAIGRFGGGVEMLRLEDGATLWIDEASLQPLAIAAGRVLTRRDHPHPNVLALALLDAGDGSLRASATATLPFEVDTWRHDFHLHAAVAGDAFVLDWRQERRYSGGAPPAQAVLREMAVGTIDAGTVRIDARSGFTTTENARAFPEVARKTDVHIDGVTYVVTSDDALEARDATTGALRWRHVLPSPPAAEAAPLPM